MNNQALQYYMHDGSSAFRFELAGDLTSEGARRLERDWYTASSVIGHRTLVVDMTFLTSADEEGRALLARWHAGGARLIANSRGSSDLAEAIVGHPLPEFASMDTARLQRTWLPFRSSFAASLVLAIILLVALLFPMRVSAASLAEVEVPTLRHMPDTWACAPLVFRIEPQPMHQFDKFCGWNAACLVRSDRAGLTWQVHDAETKES